MNDADAAILAAHWGEGTGEESVPEPGSLALLAGVVVMGMVYLRRRDSAHDECGRPKSTLSALVRRRVEAGRWTGAFGPGGR